MIDIAKRKKKKVKDSKTKNKVKNNKRRGENWLEEKVADDLPPQKNLS